MNNYDIISVLEDLELKHRNSIPVLGGARFAIECVDNIEQFIGYFPTVIHNAKFFHYYKSPANACRTFCHLCLIDPTLIELYIGMKFEELVEV